MIVDGLGGRRRRYRPGQSAVLFGLATLVIVACAVGPLFERAVEQASIRSTLTSADRVSRGLVINVDPGVPASAVAPGGAAARLFGKPVRAIEVPAGVRTTVQRDLATTLTYRDDECRHLVLARGRCPTGYDEVVASVPSAARLHLAVGKPVRLVIPTASAHTRLDLAPTVVGFYKAFAADNDYWFGAHYSSRTGITFGGDSIVADAFFGAASYVESTGYQLTNLLDNVSATDFVVVPLRAARIGVGDIPVLRKALLTETTHPKLTTAGQPVLTALPQLLNQAEAGRRDAQHAIFPVALALALLATLALAVVVGAAADQRRPELALARLRGYGVRSSACVFVQEIGALVVASIGPGIALAWLFTLMACDVWLVPGIHPELRWPVFVAAGGALFVMLVIVGVAGWRRSGQQISDMLRRSSRLRVGLAEVAVVVAAVAGLVAAAGSGGKDSALTTLAPTFVALVIGLVGGRLMVIAARRVGDRALWRGALVRAIAALNISRRPGGRLIVSVLCVATALLVFAGQQWSVATTNRAQRSAAESGAAVDLDVSAASAERLIAAVRAADPSGTYATPVVIVYPPGINAVPTIAVDPASFARVASWGRPSLRPSAALVRHLVAGPTAPAISFTGSELRLALQGISFSIVATAEGGTTPAAASVRFDLRLKNGALATADFGPLTTHTPEALTKTATVPCENGCQLTGIEIARSALDQNAIAADFTVASLTAHHALRIGRAADWASLTTRRPIVSGAYNTAMTASDAAGGLHFHAVDDGTGTSMQYLVVPVAQPALLAGTAPDAVDDLGYRTATTLDGRTGRIQIIGRVAFVPQVGAPALLINLPLAATAGTGLDATAHPEVWLRTDDSAREKRLVAVLHASGMDVVARTSSAQRLGHYARSAPGWSALFALVVAVLAVLLALALLVLVVLTTRPMRQEDLAALRLSGLPVGRLRAASMLELLVFVVVGVLAGGVAGLIGVRLTLRTIPIFTGPAAVPLPADLGLRAAWLAGSLLLVVVLLAPVGAALGAQIAGAATPARAVGESR